MIGRDPGSPPSLVRRLATIILWFAVICSTAVLFTTSCSVGGTESDAPTVTTAPTTADTSADEGAAADSATRPTSDDSTTSAVASSPAVNCGDLTDTFVVEARLAAIDELEALEIGLGPTGTWIIVVCGMTDVVFDSGSSNRPLDVHVVDIEGDGIDELLVGTAFGAGPFAGDLVRHDGNTLTASGYDIVVSPGEEAGRSFSCVDTDGDGVRELVGVTYDISTDNETVVWSGFRYDGLPMSPNQGTLNRSTDEAMIKTLQSGTCGNDLIIPTD